MNVDKDFISTELKNKIDIQYHFRVFQEGKKIKPEYMIEPQKPEDLVGQIFTKLLKILKIPDTQVVAQNRIKLYDLFKEKKYRYPDFKIVKHRQSQKNLLIELEPFNTDIYIGVNQAKEWIQDISIGTYNNALAMNLNNFILIYFDGSEIKQKEFTFEEVCDFICDVVFGKKPSIRLEDINQITDQFYNQFYALIHSGSYRNVNAENITISKENCLIDNLLYDERLEENKKIEFIYSIFNRLIFIKILMDWELFPKIFNYFRTVPSHLIYTELNNLFFKTLAILPEKRVNLPSEYEKVPFLNGGLFRITKIERENPDLMIKPEYLIKIFDFLEEYSFLNESNNNHAINSEILGYIFEKTIEFRKGTGSYYTHNLICDFMCENVLYPHLVLRINDYLMSIGYKEAEIIKNFEEIFMLKETTLFNIYDLIIKKVKVCDICVGSGAFLLAMGNLLLEIHGRILKLLNKDNNETEIKQYIVEYNLFGVDLMLSAIQICQLRLWLWITENSQNILPLPNIEYNLRVGNTLLGSDSVINIRTVNFKFIQKVKNSHFFDKENPIYDGIIQELESGVISFNNLKKLKKVLLDFYLNSHDENTELLKDLIESLNEMIIEDADLIYLDFLKSTIKTKNLKESLSPEFLRHLKAFHWYIEFPQIFPKGFDIIIGNPPYVSTKFLEKIPLEQDIQALAKSLKKKRGRLEQLRDESTIKRYQQEIQVLDKEITKKTELLGTEYYQKEKVYNTIYKNYLKEGFKWTYKIYDILVPFFERGFRLLKNNYKTYLSFITSNKFLATDYGEILRRDLLQKHQIDLLVDISMIRVFKDAAVYPIIISIRNRERISGAIMKIGRYKDINNIGMDLYNIDQERYNQVDINYLIYIPLFINSFYLFDKLYNHLNCTTVGNEFNNYYREFDFTHWGKYEIFVSPRIGEKLGEDYLNYVTNNDISPFQINKDQNKYFHREIDENINPEGLIIEDEKWEKFKNELLMIKEVALDLICARGENYVNIGKLYALSVKEDSELNNLSTYYFLALFNSRLLDFYFRVVFWNTHLSGGYLNYHFSYLSILPILKINSKSKIYDYIVFLAKCLEVKFEDIIKIVLDLLIIHAYFPEDMKIQLDNFNFLDNFLENDINEDIVNEIKIRFELNDEIINRLIEQDIYKVMAKERKFKG
ncbi:MAG: Eco57I restriction-modification methylase domain-containing protein [Promethearchaeota archaeon]